MAHWFVEEHDGIEKRLSTHLIHWPIRWMLKLKVPQEMNKLKSSKTWSVTWATLCRTALKYWSSHDWFVKFAPVNKVLTWSFEQWSGLEGAAPLFISSKADQVNDAGFSAHWVWSWGVCASLSVRRRRAGKPFLPSPPSAVFTRAQS